jgi:hypothetical protein
MASDRLNSFLNVAVNVGVVLGLGPLALELRQGTLATQATLHLDLVAYGRENAELLIENEELADFVALEASGIRRSSRQRSGR